MNRTFLYCLLAVSLIALSSAANATGKKKPPHQDHTCQGGHNCNQYGGGDSEADAEAKAVAKSTSHAEGGDAHAEGGQAHAEGGHAEGGHATGGNIEAGAVAVNDTSSYSYRYEEAAASAAILWGQVCQDTTNLQGVSFGVGSQKQSAFCSRLSLAQGYFAAAMMMECAAPENVAGKGVQAVRSPSPSACELDMRRSYRDGLDELAKAEALLDSDKPGWIKKAWNWLW